MPYSSQSDSTLCAWRCCSTYSVPEEPSNRTLSCDCCVKVQQVAYIQMQQQLQPQYIPVDHQPPAIQYQPVAPAPQSMDSPPPPYSPSSPGGEGGGFDYSHLLRDLPRPRNTLVLDDDDPFDDEGGDVERAVTPREVVQPSAPPALPSAPPRRGPPPPIPIVSPDSADSILSECLTESVRRVFHSTGRGSFSAPVTPR